MKLLIIIGCVLLICGCMEEGEKPNGTDNRNTDARLLGEWHSTDYRYEITFLEDQTYESNFIDSGSWYINNSELVLGENIFDYEFLGEKLHLMPLYLFFEKDG